MKGLDRVLRPLRQRVLLMIARGVVELVNDSKKLQELQVSLLAGEMRDGAERFQNYGFTSHPHPGAEAVAAAVAGNRDHLVVIAVDDRRYRKRDLAEGEVAMYSDEGDSIVLKRGRIVEVVAGTKLRVVAPLTEIIGNMTVTGNVTVAGTVQGLNVVGTNDTTGGGKSLKTHTHGGVQTGSGSTGAPT